MPAVIQNDADRFLSALATHANQLLNLVEDSRSLVAFEAKLDLNAAINADEVTISGPQTKQEVAAYLTLCGALLDSMDNVAVPALDRRQVAIIMGREPVI